VDVIVVDIIVVAVTDGGGIFAAVKDYVVAVDVIVIHVVFLTLVFLILMLLLLLMLLILLLI
jgi:hypothetical protein